MKTILHLLFLLSISSVYANDDMTLVCNGIKTTTYFSPKNPNGELLKKEKHEETYQFVNHKLQNKYGYTCSTWSDEMIFCSHSVTSSNWITASSLKINRYAGTVEENTFSGPPETDKEHNKETEYSFEGKCIKGVKKF